MAMNIKNDEAQRLARELADLTGETVTSAVTVAVRERLERVRAKNGKGLTNRLLKIGRECAAHLSASSKSLDHGEWLYDEKGLPR